MRSQVPAAARTLRVLSYLATQPEPVPLEQLARAVGMPRSSAYHLVNVMIAEGFVTHVADDRRYGLGVAAFEVGSGYTRQVPLQRLARRPLVELVDRLGESGHLAALHGCDVLYVLEERAAGRATLVTDVGVRLPAQLTASGRAILSRLPPAQVRALFPDRESFVTRRGVGPASLSALNALLVEVRQLGYATEDGDVTAGLSSIAAPVLDPSEHPIASVAVTFESGRGPGTDRVVDAVLGTARLLSDRVRGRRTADHG